MRHGSDQAVLLIWYDELVSFKHVYALLKHLHEDFLVALDALDGISQVVEQQLFGVGRVAEEELQLVDLFGDLEPLLMELFR